MERSEHLPGGSGGVWRVRGSDGTTRVHRPTGPWTPAVHDLLRYLATAGLRGVPIVQGIDAEGREVLSYLPGETLDPETVQPTLAALEAAARWLREYHDVVANYEPASAEWRQGLQPLDASRGEIICHNDPGLYNWVVVDGDFAGMIDWDRAGPGQPIDDLAFLVWSGVPLLREIPDDEAASRLIAAARAYGGVSPEGLLDAVSGRMQLIADRWTAGLARRDPGTVALRDSGIMERHHARVARFRDRMPVLRTLLAPPLSFGDGGIETALAERLGRELEAFAAFPLLSTPAGRDALREYYRPFLEHAAAADVPLVLDTPTWRANPDWLQQFHANADEVNTDAVALVRDAISKVGPTAEVEVNGVVGPRYDDYDPATRMTAAEAEAYHGPQVRALAAAGADRVTAVTMPHAAEAIGVVRAAEAARIPAVVSFVVDSAGRLHDGAVLADAIAAVDAATGGSALGFAVNCAHPNEAARAFAEDRAEHGRVIGFRLNAATAGGGADEAGDRDPDTPEEFAAGLRELAARVPSARVFGGCCGTDAPHILAAITALTGRSAAS